MIIIRDANKDDINTIVDFNSAMAMETESKELNSKITKQGVNTVINNKNRGFYLIAESDGLAVGQLMVTTEWSDWRNSEFWWIQSVYISPANRQNNIYRKLYEKVLELAKQNKNVCGIRLYVDKNNQIAQKVYTKLGMQISNYLFFEKEW